MSSNPLISGPGADPQELAKLYGIDMNAPSPNGSEATAAPSQDREQVDLSLYPSVIDALLKITKDRSDDTYFVVAACREAGLNLAQIRYVVDSRSDLKQRLAGRKDDDVWTCWKRHAAATAWTLAGGPPQAAATGPQAAPAPGAAPPPGPGRFFGRTGLRVRDLADEVMAGVTCGFGYPDLRFYVYENGVWSLDEGQLKAEMTRLLGNRYRITHRSAVLDMIECSPTTPRITDNPLSEYINVPNGMIRWETGDLLPHNPDYLSTVQLPVEYVPGATCPRFDQFLAEVLPPDLISSGFIWELIGYTLYSGNPLHTAILLLGHGRNGKGVMIRVLKVVLGEHNCSTVGLHQLIDNKFRAATLYGKLANLAGDLDSKWLENTALFKSITGGDTIQAENKYGKPFDFTPWGLPFYSANRAFGSPDSSEGWVARWTVVPFPNSFLGREDRTLDAKLTSESELRGILAKGVAALPALMARGRFAEPASLTEAKAAFVLASDAIRAWVDEYCVVEPGSWVDRKGLYQAYLLRSGAPKPLSPREFYNRIEQISGIYEHKKVGVRGFAGVRLARTW